MGPARLVVCVASEGTVSGWNEDKGDIWKLPLRDMELKILELVRESCHKEVPNYIIIDFIPFARA